MHFSQSGLVKLWSFVSFYLALVRKHCIYFNVVSLCMSLKHFDAIIISICVVYSYHGYRSHIDYIDRCLQLQHKRPVTLHPYTALLCWVHLISLCCCRSKKIIILWHKVTESPLKTVWMGWVRGSHSDLVWWITYCLLVIFILCSLILHVFQFMDTVWLGLSCNNSWLGLGKHGLAHYFTALNTWLDHLPHVRISAVFFSEPQS